MVCALNKCSEGSGFMDTLESQLKSLVAKTDFSRRGFVMTSLASGFALAAQPVMAQSVITTDSNGLTAGEVTIKVADGTIPAYRAMPAKGGPFPTVLVIQEIFGVHEHIKDLCRRLGKAGYLAVAPALYARQGDVSGMSDIQEIMTKVVSKVPDKQVMSDLDATAAWARHNKGDAKRMAVTGFCWGGRETWLYAEHNPHLKAAVAWYGPLNRPTNELAPSNPPDGIKALKVPVLGLYGAADTGIPVADVEKMRDALKAAKKKAEIVIYPDTPHGFNADYRPSYRAEAAKDGWGRMLAWFKKYGAA
jgi:carboxymethylenebutenolidase